MRKCLHLPLAACIKVGGFVYSKLNINTKLVFYKLRSFFFLLDECMIMVPRCSVYDSI